MTQFFSSRYLFSRRNFFNETFFRPTDELRFPRGAPVDYGVSEAVDGFQFDKLDPGDIVHGIADPVPGSHPDFQPDWKDDGSMRVKMKVWNPLSEEFETLFGHHWGNGIILLEREEARIKLLLEDCLEKKEAMSSHLENALLRAFFPARSYIRLYFLGGSRGERLTNHPFLDKRMEAIVSEYSDAGGINYHPSQVLEVYYSLPWPFALCAPYNEFVTSEKQGTFRLWDFRFFFFFLEQEPKTPETAEFLIPDISQWEESSP